MSEQTDQRDQEVELVQVVVEATASSVRDASAIVPGARLKVSIGLAVPLPLDTPEEGLEAVEQSALGVVRRAEEQTVMLLALANERAEEDMRDEAGGGGG